MCQDANGWAKRKPAERAGPRGSFSHKKKWVIKTNYLICFYTEAAWSHRRIWDRQKKRGGAVGNTALAMGKGEGAFKTKREKEDSRHFQNQTMAMAKIGKLCKTIYQFHNQISFQPLLCWMHCRKGKMEETERLCVRQERKIRVIPAGYNLSRVQSGQFRCAGSLRKPSMCVLRSFFVLCYLSSKTKQSCILEGSSKRYVAALP